MDISDWKITLASDLYEAGVSEDGATFYAEAYHIEIVRNDGKKYAHKKVWPTAERYEGDDDGYYIGFSDEREEMKVKVADMMIKIAIRGFVNLDHWVEVEPSYGSDYYVKTGGDGVHLKNY